MFLCSTSTVKSRSSRLQRLLVLDLFPDYKALCDHWFVDTKKHIWKCGKKREKITSRNHAFLRTSKLKNLGKSSDELQKDNSSVMRIWFIEVG